MLYDIIDKKLSKLFINLAKGERKAEILRQVLCGNEDFNPFQLFKLLDKENKNFINTNNILNYLTSKGISSNKLEVDLLILFYDQNYDKVLSYEEFQNLIICSNYPVENQIQNYPLNAPISFNVSYSFAKLLEREIQLTRNILSFLNELQNNKNFNIHELYHKVKRANYIEENGLKNFLNRNNEYFLDSDIISILKRLDLNKDGKVDLCEFHLFLGFPNCVYCCPCMACCHCGTCYCNICFCQHICHYHKRTHRSYNSPSRNPKNISNSIENNNMNYENNSNLNDINNNNIYNNKYNLENTKNNYNYNFDNNKGTNNNDNYNNNKFNGFSTKTKEILYNNYEPITDMEYNQPYFNSEVNERNPINLNNGNNNIDENELNSKKISKSLTIRPSPERKNPKINNDLSDNRTIQNTNIYNYEYNPFNQNNNDINLKIYNYQNKANLDQKTRNNIDNLNPGEQIEYQNNQINDLKYSNNSLKPYNQNEYEENQFNDFIRQIMLAEGQLEKIKVSLALCPDFNCEDCFRIFEVDGKGVLSPEDIKSGLNLIGVFYSDFEVKLFFKRFDLQKRGYINYSDFFDVFVPFQREYRTLVEERKPNSCCPCRCPDIFCPETLSLLKNLMDAIIKNENNFNFLRRGFTTLNLKLKDIFGNIDVMKMGYFTNNDLTVYLKKNKIFSNSLENDLLFIRLDKNRNGKIDYKEIYDETHPLYDLN